MNWDWLLAGLGLACIIEGLLPFINPGKWREVFAQLLGMGDGQIRFFGMISLVIGVVLVWLSR